MNQIKNTNFLILLQSAKKLGLKTQILSVNPPKVKFSYQNKSHLISEKSFNLNLSQKAKVISKNKSHTLNSLKKAHLPTPHHLVIQKLADYQQTLKTIPFPQTIKPLTGEKGQYIHLNITSLAAGHQAVKQILDHYPKAIVESYHQGEDYRFLCLNFKLIGLAQRLPPTIAGNGQSTIRKLIKTENNRRFKLNQKQGRRLLNRIRHWPRLSWNLKQQNLTLETILSQDKTITLYPIPNFSTGGSVKTIDPKTIHPSFVKLAEKTALTINLEIIGIDILIKDLNKPASPKNSVIIEVNSDPGLRLHDWPNLGKSQHTAEKILKSIFNF